MTHAILEGIGCDKLGLHCGQNTPDPLQTLALASCMGPTRDFRTKRGSVVSMTGSQSILGGVVHDLPEDLKDALAVDPAAMATWRDITPLARNEWICWVVSAKKRETRQKRIDWGRASLREGKRRPCCWPGCPHR